MGRIQNAHSRNETNHFSRKKWFLPKQECQGSGTDARRIAVGLMA